MKKCLHDNLAGTQNGGRKVKDQKKVSEFSVEVVPLACHGRNWAQKVESAVGTGNGQQDKQECSYSKCVPLAFSAVEFSFSSYLPCIFVCSCKCLASIFEIFVEYLASM